MFVAAVVGFFFWFLEERLQCAPIGLWKRLLNQYEDYLSFLSFKMNFLWFSMVFGGLCSSYE